MYRAFKTEADVFDNININSNSYINTSDLMTKMTDFILSESKDTVLDAAEIWDKWFPAVEADVFISHSSKDSALAKKCASWLYDSFQLKSFIDSEVWCYADNLLKDIDEKYARNYDENRRKLSTFDYSTRNITTANVHMLLTYSLTRMINQTECIFFLSSNNSVSIKDSIKKTFSPWIFHELATIDTIEILPPTRYKRTVASHTGEPIKEHTEFKMSYPIFDRRLIPLSVNQLTEWKNTSLTKKKALDWLYKNNEKAEILNG
ncbi:MAG TPA: hypothetical protein PL195_02920 [bacterium]|nr:hypothetical protein [bacterium]